MRKKFHNLLKIWWKMKKKKNFLFFVAILWTLLIPNIWTASRRWLVGSENPVFFALFHTSYRGCNCWCNKSMDKLMVYFKSRGFKVTIMKTSWSMSRGWSIDQLKSLPLHFSWNAHREAWKLVGVWFSKMTFLRFASLSMNSFWNVSPVDSSSISMRKN